MPLSRGLLAALSLSVWVPVFAQTADAPLHTDDDPAPTADDCGKCPAATDGAPNSAPGAAPGAVAPAAGACQPCAAGGTSGTGKPRGGPGAKTTAPPPTAAASAGALTVIAAGAGTAGGLGQTFDGGRGGEAGGVGAASYVPAAPAPPGGAQSADTRFSAALNTKMAETLAQSPVGRQVLDRLRAADGAVKLPPVVLVNSAYLGVFAPDENPPVMKLDRSNVVKEALLGVPPEGRAALARQWSDPSKLAGYLADHPAALDAVVAGYDTTFVHELTHAWQHRRDRPIDTTVDRDAQGVPREPIEWEIEAYREEMRYYHERVMRDPSVAARDHGDLDSYKSLLSSYDDFHSYVTGMYSGIASGSFPRIEAALARRKNAAGVADMQVNESAYDKREKDFIRDELPAIQRDGAERMVSYYEGSGRPDQALRLLAFAPDAIRAKDGPQALEQTLAELSPPISGPPHDRIKAWEAYVSYLVKTTGANVMTNDVFQLYRRDYRDAYGAMMKIVRDPKKSPAEHKDAQEWADSYASFLRAAGEPVGKGAP